jgi:hypothetical protein
MDPVVVYVPRFVQNGSDSLGLKELEDLDIGIVHEYLMGKSLKSTKMSLKSLVS